MAPARQAWLRRCQRCGFLASTLVAHVNASDSAIDECARARALQTLRRGNFERVLDALATAGLRARGRILDVGCAHGWFIEAARARGYDAAGLEPDDAVADAARRHGTPVRSGFFPEALEPGECFDAIVFNDVFEHLPHPERAMRAIRGRLAPGGLVAINLPIASGVFYRAASVLDHIGMHGPFDRMWQRGFPSPHVSYFTQATLAALAASCGMEERWRGFLPSLEASGLWARLRYDRGAGLLMSALIWSILRTVSPVLSSMPPDIGLQIFTPDRAVRLTP
jgi:SAM-dependent methyltransferase